VTKAEQVRLIKAAFDAIPELHDGFFAVAERLYDMNLEAERRHRHGHHPPYGLTVRDAAKLFTVSHLLDGYREPDKWTVDEILHIRTEVLYAQAYAKQYHGELAQWALSYGPQFAGVDYAELMKVAA
jgi:hypothetical protein